MLKDNGEPFVILRRLFHFADEVLEQAKPDFVCTYEYATALNGALWLAANRRGIPCLSIRFSKINSGEGFWTLDRKLLNTIAIERGTERREARRPVSAAAKAQIEKFRSRPATVAYIASKWRGHAERGFSEMARAICAHHGAGNAEPTAGTGSRFGRAARLAPVPLLLATCYGISASAPAAQL